MEKSIKSIQDKDQMCDKKKKEIIRILRAKKYRLTNQRMILLDIILQEECTSPKEIYYKAVEMDSNIGVATVYRMINTLEDIGAIQRKNMYNIQCEYEEQQSF